MTEMSEQIQKVGNYILLEKLAVGGMAEVYIAKIISSDKLVAIKKILSSHADTSEYIKLFQEEIKVSLNLKHGNIVGYYDFIHEKNELYLVMEFVNGFTLRKLIGDLKFRSSKLNLAQCLYIVSEVAAGLDHAHRSVDSITHAKLNVIHRDINPHNIMVGFDGNIKIIDFGIAKADSRDDVTKVGTIKGKFSYMSPEQASALPLDNRSDIYALGIVFWELLTGQKMHEGKNDLDTLKRIKSTEIRSPREIDPQISQEVEKIVLRALEKDPNKRYQKASDFRFEVNQLLTTLFPEFRPSTFADFVSWQYAELIRSRIEKFSYFSKVKLEVEGSTSGLTPPPVPNNSKGTAITESKAGVELPEGFESRTPSSKRGPLSFQQLKEEKQIFASEIKIQTKQKAANFFYEDNPIVEEPTEAGFKFKKILENSFIWNLKHLVFILIVIYAGFSFYRDFGSDLNRTDHSSEAMSVNSADATRGQEAGAKFPQDPVRGGDDFSSKFLRRMKASGQLSYVNISIENSQAADTNIYVDGKIIYNKPPLRKFPVYANQTATIVAYNARLKLYDEKKVVIPAGRTMNVKLNMRAYRRK